MGSYMSNLRKRVACSGPPQQELKGLSGPAAPWPHTPTMARKPATASPFQFGQMTYGEKIQEETDTVVGREWLPCLQDRDSLSYSNAVIHEIQRFISVLPMGLPHILTQDTHFLRAPSLLISAYRHPTHFKDPENFNPNNFLDNKGAFQNNDAFMPFALGKRICLGAGLARMEIFLFLTTILQCFTLCTVKSPQEIDLSPKSTGLGNVSPLYEHCLKIR
ncbi:cytochrome P450 2B1-like [Notamacropus eugenii]|uniref:cytochrome P450 2B1-like n=1 Tax=Notamacropus eugenii TaxID=9315 RepID=UPI003B685B5F